MSYHDILTELDDALGKRGDSRAALNHCIDLTLVVMRTNGVTVGGQFCWLMDDSGREEFFVDLHKTVKAELLKGVCERD